MTMPRAHLVDPAVTRWYHCVTRRVRRAFLLGEGLDRKECESGHDNRWWPDQDNRWFVVDVAGRLNCRVARRDPRFIIHDQRTMLAQRVIAIALGYEDLNDHQTLRVDPALQLGAGQVPEPEVPLASPPTLCRIEKRVDHHILIKIAEVLVDQFIAAHPQLPEHLILDFDATDDPVHGKQEKRFFPVSTDGPIAADFRLVQLRGCELGPVAACDRQGRAHGARQESPVPGGERAR
jgi:Transposase DDE domain group 1